MMNIVRFWMPMELNMMNDMRLVINVILSSLWGSIGIISLFVGRSSIAFHNLPDICRHYVTLRSK